VLSLPRPGERRGVMGDGAARASETPPAEAVDEAVAENGATGWPDDTAEAAFRAEARERGEPDLPAAAALVEAAEEIDSKGLPPMEELVKRIPPAAREALDELFRAKFTGVKRVPAKALKS